MVCPGAVGLAHGMMLNSVFSCLGCAVQLTHLTRVIIRVHILLRPSADDGNSSRDWEGGATLSVAELVDELNTRVSGGEC